MRTSELEKIEAARPPPAPPPKPRRQRMAAERLHAEVIGEFARFGVVDREEGNPFR